MHAQTLPMRTWNSLKLQVELITAISGLLRKVRKNLLQRAC
jgi:hypothetical protein